MDGTMERERNAAESETTVISANVIVRGDVEGPTDLHVSGRILGGVKVIGLVLEADAEIEGSVSAEAAVIAGFVNGAVEAKAVHVKSSARINGDVSYETIQIEAGGRVSGRLIVGEIGEEETAKATPAPARRSGKSAEADGGGQELARMAARLRRAAE